jgi:hypothetical protein
VNAYASPVTTVSADFTNGYNQSIQLACNGLPAGVTCAIPSILFPAAPSTPISVSGGQGLSAQDYPFSITGTAGNLNSTSNATLRVLNFTAALQTDTGSLASGQSVTVNVQLSSNNHFVNGNISISCQTPSTVTCTTTSEYAALSDDGTVTVPLTVKYQASTSSAQRRAGSRVRLPDLLIPVLLLSSRRRRRTRWTALLALMGAALLGMSFTACGGRAGSASGSGGTPPAPTSQTISVR